MGKYICGPSVLRLTGRVGAIIPSDRFEHDFSPAGPEGVYGPAREAAMLSAGSMRLQDGEISEADRLEHAESPVSVDAVQEQPTVDDVDTAAEPPTDTDASSDTAPPAARSARRRSSASKE